MDKYGTRIYPLDEHVILIKQTVKRSVSTRYVVDTLPNGDHREAHINIDDDKDIANAVRTALKGNLQHN